jgi:hypothetical protein
MRLSVAHRETFTFEPASLGTIQVLRMTPRDHTGQYVCEWDIEVDADCQMTRQHDAFGNIVTSFSLSGPLPQLTISAIGEVETEAHHGIVRGTMDTVPLGVFLRLSGLNGIEAAARRLVVGVDLGKAPPIEAMHTLMAKLHAASRPDEKADGQAQSQQEQNQQLANVAASPPAMTEPDRQLAASLVSQQVNDPQSLALVLCDAARMLGLPARLISGVRLLEGARQEFEARRPWGEVFIEGLGWIGFDPAEDSCPSDESIRIAAALDAQSVQPVRISHYGVAPSIKRQTHIALARIAG